MVCYDICSRDSFNHIQRWLEEAKTYSHEQLLFILVGNKSDEEKEYARSKNIDGRCCTSRG